MVGTPPERAVVQFAIDGELQSVEPLGRGHIHRTWCSRFRGPAGERRFVHQRINRAVFEQPDRVMDNIARVTGHLRRKFREAGSDPTRRTLTIVPARDGSPLLRTIDGEYWRTYRYIDHASTFDAPRDEAHVFQVGQAFATFLRMLADLEGPPLYETIRRFGDTRLRFERFVDVTNRDPLGRAGAVADEIAFVRRRERLAALVVELIAAGAVPRRVAHHDTKINNVLIDDATDEGICVIDLDTVMAGTVLYDFGDAVRFATCRAAEDEPDPGRARFEPELFEALGRGYLAVARALLVTAEIDHLVDASIALTFVAGLRFLTDHLAGDRYFRATRPGQNLDRARVQFVLVEQMERAVGPLRAAIARCR